MDEFGRMSWEPAPRAGRATARVARTRTRVRDDRPRLLVRATLAVALLAIALLAIALLAVALPAVALGV